VGENERPSSRPWVCSRSCRIRICADSSLATGEPEGVLVHVGEAPRINATILSLVRNSELEGMISSMKDLERTWNRKFNYPWTFFNDEPFTEEFKRRTRAETKAECRYGTFCFEEKYDGTHRYWRAVLNKHCRAYTEGALGCPQLDQ
jgi:Glycolipid 2-alpha-mannosyltransferase